MLKKPVDKCLHDYSPFGFQLSQKAWERYDLRNLFDSLTLDQTTSEVSAIRRVADRINKQLRHDSHLSRPIQAGQLISVGIISDVLRYVILAYSYEETPGVMAGGLDWTRHRRGESVIQQPSSSFVNLFPPPAVILKQKTGSNFLRDRSALAVNREIIISEMILLYLTMGNPAFAHFRILFDDKDLRNRSPYVPMVKSLEEYFNRQPAFGPLGLTLFEVLRAPMQDSPDSLEGQLSYIRKHWAAFLPDALLEKLLLALGILREETLMRGFGPGQIEVLRFGKGAYGLELDYPEHARFSEDADWMSNVVIIAKSTYVWLDQLSKRYKRDIKHLSDIPDEELDRLARWGFTGLWLIGLWERSAASQTIKQIMGNPEAAPSAYSLYDYVIAEDLGGEDAYQNLRDRATQRGIRLASDMVPNHMGIYSKWVIEHPEWFIQTNTPPYHCYQYTGVDLSPDPRVTIQIEDGYWEHRDAAVVFKRIDQWTGETRYIYHGNDGTSTPWNDTAQLDFLLPQVREAVIQTIIHVARRFPIIRFDAAMTLAKRHYHRLWFPKPGEGGAIPSRSEHGMSKADFDAVFPEEFWREVVDRVAAEVPDTLLLAEAFWLMEGYFVRTLGMHRVYNSAFMNMLKMEDNSKYRMTVKNVLEFSSEVLKRFVNFMNNPDEATAVEQFGKDDKYYGVAVMMVTMPGLPMFGHGQVEGLTEKYGMEYRRAYWDEQVDDEMVRRHEREIFPLMQRRRLFSGAENFAFFDFRTQEGWVDENVFAYSNRAGNERAIILYNNAYNSTSGWIHTSTAINMGKDDEKNLIRYNLAEALALNTSDGCLYVFRDYRSGLEYLRSGQQIAEKGIFAVLAGYQYHAFMDFREIHDHDGSWTELAGQLNGQGVTDVEEAFREMRVEPVLGPFRKVVNAEMLVSLADDSEGAHDVFSEVLSGFLRAAVDYTGVTAETENIARDIQTELNLLPLRDNELFPDVRSVLVDSDEDILYHVLRIWIIVRHLGRLKAQGDDTSTERLASQRFDDWLLGNAITETFRNLGTDDSSARADALLVKVLLLHEEFLTPRSEVTNAEVVKTAIAEPSIRDYLLVNRYDDHDWINKERLERLLTALLHTTVFRLLATGDIDKVVIKQAAGAIKKVSEAAERAGYQIDRMIKILSNVDVSSVSLKDDD